MRTGSWFRRGDGDVATADDPWTDPGVVDDMDGVLIRERHAIPGANRFLQRLHELGHRFLVITNNSV